MSQERLSSFLFEHVKPFFEKCWNEYKFLVFEGCVLLIKSKEDLAIQMTKFSDFGVRIWTFDDMLNHISDTKDTSMSTHFEWVIRSFEKKFGALDDRKVKILTNIFGSIIWDSLFNKDKVPRIWSVIDVTPDNVNMIDSEIIEDFKFLNDSDTIMFNSKTDDYKSDWVIDARESINDSFKNQYLSDKFRYSFLKNFSDDESFKLNPIHNLRNWEKKLLVLFVKNDWDEGMVLDFRLLGKYAGKSQNFIHKHLNLEKIYISKNFIDTIWTEKSSLSLLKITGL